jgi:hypothetical protein
MFISLPWPYKANQMNEALPDVEDFIAAGVLGASLLLERFAADVRPTALGKTVGPFEV